MADDIAEALALHDRHHDRLRETLFALLERLVAVDVDGARSCFATFVKELECGLQLEEDVVLPAYRPRQPIQGPGRADHVEGDHVILRRGIEFVEEFLADVARAPSLRSILEGLPAVYRLLGTLEHHGERERRHVYPVALVALDAATRATLVVSLRHLAEPAPLA
jgi:hypothetical protein